MWHRTTATTIAAIALIAASCGGETGVQTTGTVPSEPGAAAVESPEVVSESSSPSPTRDPAIEPLPPPTPTTPPTDPRWPGLLADARSSMIAGECGQAIDLFDALLTDEAWLATSNVVDQVRTERDDCADLEAIRAQASGPADTMTQYVQFLDERPGTSLEAVVVAEMRQLHQTAGAAALDVDSCDAIGDGFDLLGAATTDAQLACATAFAAAGRTGDASALAAGVLPTADDQAAVDTAIEILTNDPAICSRLGSGIHVVDPTARPGRHAALLQSCMTAAADDPAQLAMLQITFIVELPEHRSAPAVEAAMIENVAVCDHLDWMEELPAFSDRQGFLLDKTFGCAQFAAFVDDLDTAIDLYRSFLDRAPGDQRAAEAEAGLARSLLADAKLGVTSEIERPPRSGSTSGGQTVLRFGNDTVYEQHIVVVGPDSRVVSVPASPTSSTYAQRPQGCRTDVPTVTIELSPGTYEVMVYDDVAAPEVGTWRLEGGAEYGWCAFYVRA